MDQARRAQYQQYQNFVHTHARARLAAAKTGFENLSPGPQIFKPRSAGRRGLGLSTLACHVFSQIKTGVAYGVGFFDFPTIYGLESRVRGV